MTQVLNPLTLPLQGSRLIEASAGTGKTWTIAALFVRLVLGHGPGAVGPLMPGQILVMTFTKAATRELSDRIRRRLVEAAAVMRGEAAPAAQDAFLHGLLADHAQGPVRSAAAWRLAMAAEAMDDAAVHTIDAWCQRMLREHAFDSGCLFDEELQADPGALLTEAVHDYWRQQVYPLDDAALAVVLALWPSVERLHHSVRPLAEHELPPAAGSGTLAARVQALTAQRLAALSALKTGWLQRATALRAWLDAQVARKDCPFDKRSLQAQHFNRWLDKLTAWAQDPQQDELDLGTGMQRLTPAGLQAILKPGEALPELPDHFAAFADLMDALDRLPAPAPALRAHAAARIGQRVQQLQRQAGSFGFIDMLRRLDQALDDGRNGDAARRLRQRIVQQYPVALVDEFQDTSPLQLRIFDRLYRVADAGNDTGTDAGGPGTTLLLIGDPKQSIYGFRGADIYSYLGARRATVGRHHVLGTNHRSTAALVQAVNHLFRQAERRPGAGAFGMRDLGDADGVDKLPFIPVAARGRDERLLTSAGEPAALTLVVQAALNDVKTILRQFAALCAEQVVTLLNDAGCGFRQDSRPFVRLRPADIAVLVRNRREAAAVRSALQRRGLSSVYLSDKDSVFDGAEAQDLLRLLRAVAAPRDVRLARAALATPLLGLGLDELQALALDDEQFDAQAERLQGLHAVWQAQGVLAMLRRALHAFDLPARWLAQPDGERRLTNVLHLAELLQTASATLDGEPALLRWLSGRIDGGGADDEQVLRLESDADLVQVVTVHKSKGLEYPLVMLPFASLFRPGDDTLMLPDAQGRLHLVLDPGDEDRRVAERERLREDLRLLYVALTRPRHALWVGVAGLKDRSGHGQWHRSAIGCLVSGPDPRTPEQMAADLQALSAQAGIHVQAVGDEPPPVTPLQPRDAAPPLLVQPAYAGVFERQWAIGSYSALVRAAAAAAAVEPRSLPALAHRVRDDEPLPPVPADAPPRLPQRLADQPWHRFPRGAFPGNFLHGLLEWLAGEGFALDEVPALQQALLKRCEQQGWGHRADDVLAWLRRLCRTPLPPLGGAALCELDQPLPEMEFWYPSDGLRTAEVDRLCRAHWQPGQDRPALAERTLRGLLMGFADLCFEHDGRWWVLDHKSNALGGDDAAYTPAAMADAVLAHRYDVQAALYQLALHRLLRLRLGAAYRPAVHLGGTVFLFLRGLVGPARGCCHVPATPALIDGLDAMIPPPAAPV